MCGRFTNRYTWRELHALYMLSVGFPQSNFRPRYNIAPTQIAPVVRLEDGTREIAFLKWGLVPSWAKDANGGAKLINARAETVADKPAYKNAFQRRRCLVIADGFYEWKKESAKAKQPYFITLKDNAPFAFAGLFEHWKPNDVSDLIETFTIITTTANELIAPLHDRMPVILAPDNWPRWLGEGAGPVAPDRLKAMLAPFPAGRMTAWPVTKAVGNVKNDDPSLVQAV
ncbi:MAG: SOS response-associated peptidase [Alphaproteobacteria bacterium]|nr:SOS response-associated peptidase [Alphaproteobacteria bacterium]